MAHIYTEKKGRGTREVYYRRFPVDVHPITGPKFVHKWPQGITRQQANDDLTVPAEWKRRIDEARAQLRDPGEEPRYDWPANPYQPFSARIRKSPPPANVIESATVVVDSETVIGLWRDNLKHVPQHKAIKRKRAVVTDLFKFLRQTDPLREFEDPEDGKTYRAYNLAAASSDDLQRYKESLTKAQQADVINHINAIYNAAATNQKFAKLPGGNPAEKLTAPPKPKPDSKWEPYTETEAAKIFSAALSCVDPAVKWIQVLSCYLGTITSEIARRKISDFKIKNGIEFLDIPEGKTDCRPRELPLPVEELRRLGFFDYLDQRREDGTDAPLFGNVKPATTANRCRSFVRDKVGIKDDNKQSNGWRKRFINALIDGDQEGRFRCDSDRRRYLSGHSAKDVHGENYLRHPVRQTKPILDALNLNPLRTS